MRQMKDSGIEWIGQIPQEWEILTFQQATERMATGLNPRDNFVLTADDEVFYVTIKNFKNGKLFLDENCDKISVEAFNLIQQRSQLQKGDILFASISEEGNAYIIDENPKNWNINESVFVIRPNSNRMTTKYFYYHLTDVGYYSDLRNDATGATFQSIKQNKLRKSRMVMPPLAEQIRITDFLDVKCAEIDNLIAAKEKTNALLRERRQSIIYEAVTKGLNPDAPMKDSGIEWIGQIPEHWSAKRIKHLGTFRNGLTYSPDNVTDSENGTLVLRSSNIQKGSIVLEDNVYVDMDVPAVLQVSAGDILICSRNGSKELIGKNAIIPENLKASFGAFMMIFRCDASKYLYYILNSNVFSYYLGTFLTSTVNQLTAENFGNMKVVYCDSAEEREKIVSYLDSKCLEIDNLISANEATIQKLKEYRQSIIYEAVTGKIEV